MADYTIAAGDVVPGADATTIDGECGEAINAGESLYLDTTANQWFKTDVNVSAAKAKVGGIAISSTDAAKQRVGIQTSGTLAVGAVLGLLAGEFIISSATAGGLAPSADLASGWFSSLAAIGKSTTEIIVIPKPSGVQKA